MRSSPLRTLRSKLANANVVGYALGLGLLGCSGHDGAALPQGSGGSAAGPGGSSSSVVGGASGLGGNAAMAGGGAVGGSTIGGGSPKGSPQGGANSVGGSNVTRASGGSNALGGSANLGGAQAGGASNGGAAVGGAFAAGGNANGGSSAGTTNGGTGPRGGAATGGISSKGGASNSGGLSGGGTAAGGTVGATPGLRIVGRTAPGTSNGSVRFSWPGVAAYARFTGTQISIDLNDGSNRNRFTVVVDNGTPKTVTSASGQSSVLLASNLASGTHDLVVWRNTEAAMGVTQFNGFTNFGTDGALLAPPAAPTRRIEVIGDSLSVGAGNEGTSACPGGIDAFTNNYLAYGSVAARAVSADVVTIAWSGIGVYRNYGDSTSNTMPARYPYAIPNDGAGWDFGRYQPHVVVVNLGTNDFGSGDPGAAYESAYVNFVKTVRSKYADAHFILIDMYGGTRLTRINNVIAALKGGGESKVEMLSFNSVQNNLGCNQHPNVAAHAAMGNMLANRLKSLMGW